VCLPLTCSDDRDPSPAGGNVYDSIEAFDKKRQASNEDIKASLPIKYKDANGKEQLSTRSQGIPYD
jgi:hypothetical protein